MTFQVLLDTQSLRDFESVESYLDSEAPEQTDRFIDDFEAALARIADHPLLRAEVRPGVRHESLSVFKYHVWYRVFAEIEHVEVFAVLHHRTGPEVVGARVGAGD